MTFWPTLLPRPGTKMLPSVMPNCAAVAAVYWRTAWRAVTWPISCPSTPAISASLPRYASRPRVM